MTFKFTSTLAFRGLGALLLSLALVSCSALGLPQVGKHPPSKSKKEHAQKPPTREVTIPLEKAKPSELPRELTQIQPALKPREVETKELRFTMSARGVDIKNVLFALSQEIEQNIIIDPGVNKLASVDLKNVTLEEALRSLLPPLRLEYEISENFIRVRREKMQTRTFFLNYVISKRRGNSTLTSSSGTSGTTGSTAGGTGGSSSGQSDANTRSTSSVEASEETDIWTEVLNGLKNIVTPSASTSASSTTSGDSSSDATSSASSGSSGLVASLLGGGAEPSSSLEETTPEASPSSPSVAVQVNAERAYLTVNRQAGMIVVKDFPEVLLQVAEFLEAVEGSVQRQVFIQARIIEVTLNDDYKLGVDWSQVSPITFSHADADGSNLINSTLTGAANFTYGIATPEFNMVIDALSKQGQVSVLSSPKIATLNNQRAVIKVGTEDIFFRPEVTAATTTSGATTEFIPQAITIGIVLDVVPQINPNGQIMMSINTSITEKSGERTSPDGINIVPILDVRESNNIVLAQHGQTIIIGGLMKTKKEVDDNSIPLLGAIPYLGRLFHWTQETESKTELVIMLTPEIMVGRAIDDKYLSERSHLRNLGYDVPTDRLITPSFRR